MYKKLAILLVLIAFSSSPALALTWDKPVLTNRYDLFWGGVNVGYMVADIQEQNSVYDFRLHIFSKGMLYWLTKYQSETSSRFRVGADGKVHPERFTGWGQVQSKQRRVALRYNAQGALVNEQMMPPERPGKRPVVPQSLKNGSMDALAAAFSVRESLKAYVQKGKPTTLEVPVYDGRRRYAIPVTVHGRQNLSIGKQVYKVIHVSFSRAYKAGASEKELKQLKDEPLVHVYFSDDAELLPVKAEAKAEFGSAVILFNHSCDSFEACLAPKS